MEDETEREGDPVFYFVTVDPFLDYCTVGVTMGYVLRRGDRGRGVGFHGIVMSWGRVFLGIGVLISERAMICWAIGGLGEGGVVRQEWMRRVVPFERPTTNIDQRSDLS